MATGSFRTRLVLRSVAFVTSAVLTSLSCARDQRDLTAPSRQRPSFDLSTSGDNITVQFNITPNAATSPAAAALAEDGSKISVRGVGTFVPGDPQEVTGGGSWETRDKDGNVTGSGTWQANRLLKFDFAPGALANPAIRAGLAFLQVTYSDGSQGVVAASCQLPGSPASVAEGIIASKDFVLYGNHIHSPPTFFRVLAE
jgi:hypothetical protein